MEERVVAKVILILPLLNPIGGRQPSDTARDRQVSGTDRIQESFGPADRKPVVGNVFLSRGHSQVILAALRTTSQIRAELFAIGKLKKVANSERLEVPAQVLERRAQDGRVGTRGYRAQSLLDLHHKLLMDPLEVNHNA
jgi:hypothetical protein